MAGLDYPGDGKPLDWSRVGQLVMDREALNGMQALHTNMGIENAQKVRLKLVARADIKTIPPATCLFRLVIHFNRPDGRHDRYMPMERSLQALTFTPDRYEGTYEAPEPVSSWHPVLLPCDFAIEGQMDFGGQSGGIDLVVVRLQIWSQGVPTSGEILQAQRERGL